MLRKTKIVCTLGPSTDDENVMRSLIEEGMNVARFNFSHGGHEEQFGRLTMLRKLRGEMKRPVAALLDTKGPEIRLKEFASGKVELKNGQTFTLTTEDIVGDESRVAITYKDFDLGVEIHGLLADKFGYEVGLFNGTGSSVNTATKTLSDDWHIPSLLYAGRFTYMPKGVMPSTQGNPNRLNEDKIMFGVSASINVESENESTNDTRVGVEFAMLKNKLYLGAEAYYMNVGFTDRQKINETYNYLGGYVQGGYFVAPRLQAALRYDFFNRNGTSDDGFLNMPAVGVNYFFKGCNLKLQAMYQYIARTGHDTQLDRDNDNLGLATHSATVMLQYTF